MRAYHGKFAHFKPFSEHNSSILYPQTLRDHKVQILNRHSKHHFRGYRRKCKLFRAPVKLLQPKRSFTWLFEPFSFVLHQEKRPGVGGTNIYLGFNGVLAPETGYTR